VTLFSHYWHKVEIMWEDHKIRTSHILYRVGVAWPSSDSSSWFFI